MFQNTEKRNRDESDEEKKSMIYIQLTIIIRMIKGKMYLEN